MKIIKGKIEEDFNRDFFWIKIVIMSDDESKKTQILAHASQEYLDDYNRLSGSERLKEIHFNEWVERILEKWKKLGEDIFNQNVHYDVYANTQEGEENGLKFLSKLKNNI